MTRPTALRASLLVLLAGCRACTAAEPPDLYSIERMSDPYEEGLPASAGTPHERSVAALLVAGRDLGYGEVPARVLRLRRGEGWVERLSLLLGNGASEQLIAAHEDLVDTFTEAFKTPKELKFQLRQGTSRLGEVLADDPSESTRRRAVLAEITWALYLVGTITPDAGAPPP
jgi:hypothetical protein